jgi:hypothetical protein
MNFKYKILNTAKPLVVFLLKCLKRIRGFDKSFRVYFPDINNKREIHLWELMVLNPLLNIDVNFRKNISGKAAIDIVIPVSIKDVEWLETVIKNIKINVAHPINKIYVIAEKLNAVIDICNKSGAIFVNEDKVLAYGKNSLNYIVNNVDRSGWLLQQLLKLNADTIVETENFLVLDADTIFIKPKIFLYRGKYILDLSQERHEPYHRVYEKIFKTKIKSELSFITHYMLFNKSVLKRLKHKIEEIHNKKWDGVILENVDYNDTSGFSEYELYGNFLLEFSPELIKEEYCFNSISTMLPYANYIKSVSAHSYLN